MNSSSLTQSLFYGSPVLILEKLVEDAGDFVCIIDGNLIEIGSNSNVYYFD